MAVAGLVLVFAVTGGGDAAARSTPNLPKHRPIHSAYHIGRGRGTASSSPCRPTTATLESRSTARRWAAVRFAVVKVPEITSVFWIVKVLTTGMGEATSDFLVHRMPPPVAVLIGLATLVAALWWQLSTTRYGAAPYWLAVVMVAVFGTMAADVLHIGLHVPYVVSTAFYAVSLAVVFVVWHRVEGTVSIPSISTRRRELFYWTAVMTTFALGTAAGDMSARTLR